MADTGFPRNGVPTLKLGVHTCYFSYFFPENYMKLKKKTETGPTCPTPSHHVGSVNGIVPNFVERDDVIIDLPGLTSRRPIENRRMDLSFFNYKATCDKCAEAGKKHARTVSNLRKTVAK